MSLLVAYIHWAINLDHTKMCCPVLMCWRIRYLPKYFAHDRTGDRKHTLPLFRLSTVLVLDTLFINNDTEYIHKDYNCTCRVPPTYKKKQSHFFVALYCVLVHNYLINNLHIYQKYMWISMSFLLIYEVYQLYNCWNSPQYRTHFQYCFWVATRFVCSWVKQRIYNKYLKNSQLFTSKSSQSSLINLDHQLRAKISPILFIMFHAFTSRILELLNSFIVIKSLTIEFSYIRVYCLTPPPHIRIRSGTIMMCLPSCPMIMLHERNKCATDRFFRNWWRRG